MPTLLYVLLELHSVMHSAAAEAYMHLHIVVGVNESKPCVYSGDVYVYVDI